jgi:hypothetical protein
MLQNLKNTLRVFENKMLKRGIIVVFILFGFWLAF